MTTLVPNAEPAAARSLPGLASSDAIHGCLRSHRGMTEAESRASHGLWDEPDLDAAGGRR